SLDRELTDESFVGIRMHDVRPATGADERNVFRCRVAEVIENPFSYTVMLRYDSESPASLGWEMDKALWNSMRAEEISVCLPENAIIALKG
ncbi:MAG: ABC transporter, partial [Oscillospiraceae bacterium]|nr:ABC transporter [Oscillospiraceae bacterium]